EGAAGSRRDKGSHPAPLPVLARRQDRGARARRAGGRYQERHPERAVLPGALPGLSRHAGRPHHRGDSAGRRCRGDGRGRPQGQARPLRRHRRRQVPPAGPAGGRIADGGRDRAPQGIGGPGQGEGHRGRRARLRGRAHVRLRRKGGRRM
ncbi:MAG: 3-hydroxyacyl-[acyl-carrier-protein] dehydratase, FabZ form, partial [uncultured Rubrobacteraceae bacterium]